MTEDRPAADSVREAYAGGILTRALDPSTQPAAIREFLEAEIRLLEELVTPGRACSTWVAGTACTS